MAWLQSRRWRRSSAVVMHRQFHISFFGLRIFLNFRVIWKKSFEGFNGLAWFEFANLIHCSKEVYAVSIVKSFLTVVISPLVISPRIGIKGDKKLSFQMILLVLFIYFLLCFLKWRKPNLLRMFPPVVFYLHFPLSLLTWPLVFLLICCEFWLFANECILFIVLTPSLPKHIKTHKKNKKLNL